MNSASALLRFAEEVTSFDLPWTGALPRDALIVEDAVERQWRQIVGVDLVEHRPFDHPGLDMGSGDALKDFERAAVSIVQGLIVGTSVSVVIDLELVD